MADTPPLRLAIAAFLLLYLSFSVDANDRDSLILFPLSGTSRSVDKLSDSPDLPVGIPEEEITLLQSNPSDQFTESAANDHESPNDQITVEIVEEKKLPEQNAAGEETLTYVNSLPFQPVNRRFPIVRGGREGEEPFPLRLRHRCRHQKRRPFQALPLRPRFNHVDPAMPLREVDTDVFNRLAFLPAPRWTDHGPRVPEMRNPPRKFLEGYWFFHRHHGDHDHHHPHHDQDDVRFEDVRGKEWPEMAQRMHKGGVLMKIRKFLNLF